LPDHRCGRCAREFYLEHLSVSLSRLIFFFSCCSDCSYLLRSLSLSLYLSIYLDAIYHLLRRRNTMTIASQKKQRIRETDRERERERDSQISAAAAASVAKKWPRRARSQKRYQISGLNPKRAPLSRRRPVILFVAPASRCYHIGSWRRQF
jgi:hypothetical protein